VPNCEPHKFRCVACHSEWMGVPLIANALRSATRARRADTHLFESMVVPRRLLFTESMGVPRRLLSMGVPRRLLFVPRRLLSAPINLNRYVPRRSRTTFTESMGVPRRLLAHDRLLDPFDPDRKSVGVLPSIPSVDPYAAATFVHACLLARLASATIIWTS
jgi:hypothetical protein